MPAAGAVGRRSADEALANLCLDLPSHTNCWVPVSYTTPDALVMANVASTITEPPNVLTEGKE